MTGGGDGPGPTEDGHGHGGGVDPVTLEVIDNRFDEVVREMQHVMFRTGYSTIIRDSKDGSAGLCLPDGRVIGQAFRLPLHCGVFPPTVEGVRDAFPVDQIDPGDSFVVNDPYRSGANHSPDVLVVTPVFYGGELQAFCTTIAHKPDIGGLVPGTSSPEAREIYHEGLLLPPVRYRRRGKVVDDVEAIVRNNSRTPDVTVGDIRGQVGCTDVGVEETRALLDEYGPEPVREAAEALIRSARDRVGEAVSGWDGAVNVDGQIDDPTGGDEPIRLALEVRTESDEERLTFDFTGSAPQTAGPSNMRPHVVESACLYGLVGVTDPTIPLNAGVAEACRLVLPDRSVVNPKRPAPCNNYSKGMAEVVHMCLRALSTFASDGAVAETGGKMSIAIGSRSDGGVLESDGAADDAAANDVTDRPGRSTGDAVADGFVHYEIMGSGYGGHAGGDGASCMASSYESNAELASIEIVETEFPDRVTRFSVRPDSAGPGANRGGVGFVREYEALAPLTFTYRGSKHAAGSRGVAGGGDSPPARAVHLPVDDGGPSDLAVVDTVEVELGDRVRLDRPGGAGHGDPLERDPARVLADVRDGVVTSEGARDDYGVIVVDGTDGLAVDRGATEVLRDRRRAERGAGSE